MSADWLKYALGSMALAFLGYGVGTLAEQYGAVWGLGCAGMFYMAAFLLGVQSVMTLTASWRDLDSMLYQAKRRADATTTAVLLSDNLRQMNSAAVDVLRLHGVGAWEVLPGMKMGEPPDHILYGTHVTYEFIREFLRKSTKAGVVPMQQFANDGAKFFAPARLRETWPTDREQYSEFCNYLYSLGRVTRPHGNRPHEWLGMWNPEACARSFGITLWDEADADEADQPEVIEPSDGYGFHSLKA